MVASTHALVSVFLNGMYMLLGNDMLGLISLYWSFGYFAFDVYYIIYYEKINLLRSVYLYHHFASMYMISYNHLIPVSNQLIFYGELSNLPSYVVYHFMHTDSQDVCTDIIAKMFKKIQKIVYGVIRIPVMTSILINLINTLDFNNSEILKLFAITSPVYVMGLVWSFKLIINK